MEEKFINEIELRKLVGLSRGSIRDWEIKGLFPKRRQIGPRRIAWLRSEIETWMKERPLGLANLKEGSNEK